MNRDCPDSIQLQRFFDRESPRDQRRAVAVHARRCEACRDALRGFAAVRRTVRRLSLPAATNITLARARDEFRRLRQFELIGWLRRCTAAAAAVLIVSLLAPALLADRGGTKSTSETGVADPSFVNQPSDETLTPGHSVAQWIVRDLSQG